MNCRLVFIIALGFFSIVACAMHHTELRRSQAEEHRQQTKKIHKISVFLVDGIITVTCFYDYYISNSSGVCVLFKALLSSSALLTIHHTEIINFYNQWKREYRDILDDEDIDKIEDKKELLRSYRSISLLGMFASACGLILNQCHSL